MFGGARPSKREPSSIPGGTLCSCSNEETEREPGVHTRTTLSPRSLHAEAKGTL